MVVPASSPIEGGETGQQKGSHPLVAWGLLGTGIVLFIIAAPIAATGKPAGMADFIRFWADAIKQITEASRWVFDTLVTISALGIAYLSYRRKSNQHRERWEDISMRTAWLGFIMSLAISIFVAPYLEYRQTKIDDKKENAKQSKEIIRDNENVASLQNKIQRLQKSEFPDIRLHLLTAYPGSGYFPLPGRRMTTLLIYIDVRGRAKFFL